MKIDIACHWSDDDMKSFPHLKEKNFTVMVDCDYIEDEDELISTIADEIYRDYNVVLESDKAVKNIVDDLYGVESEIWN